MDLVVHPAERLEGAVEVPPSKSYTHRALLAASLAGGLSRIENGLRSDDTAATLRACRALGARVEGGWERLRVEGFGEAPRRPGGPVNVGESGTTLRLLLPLTGLVAGRVVLDGSGSLRSRPNGYIVPALRRLGLEVRGRGPRHLVPLRAEGRGLLTGASLVLGGAIYSSQFLSGLLLACPRARGETRIRVAGRLVSRPYVDTTRDVLARARIEVRARDRREFTVPGDQAYRPFRLRIGGDWSSAAPLLVAACLVASDVTLRGLAADAQGDRAVLRFLGAMGAELRVGPSSVRVRGPFDLRGARLDLRDHPDLVPPLAIAGAFASGTTVLGHIAHLRLKESDRLGGLAATLRRLGVRARATRDSLVVEGSRSRPRPGAVPAGGDHRVAMALGVAALRAGPVRIRGAEAVSKSYPGFFRHLRALGARLAVR